MNSSTPTPNFCFYLSYGDQGRREYVIFTELHVRLLPFLPACPGALN